MESQVTSEAYSVLEQTGQIVPYGIDLVQARDVWDANRDGVVDAGAPTGANRTLCIIDSGYYQGHEDLPNAVGGYSQVDDDWSRDGNGHGSHVGGTITAENNPYGVVGVTPERSIFTSLNSLTIPVRQLTLPIWWMLSAAVGMLARMWSA